MLIFFLRGIGLVSVFGNLGKEEIVNKHALSAS